MRITHGDNFVKCRVIGISPWVIGISQWVIGISRWVMSISRLLAVVKCRLIVPVAALVAYIIRRTKKDSAPSTPLVYSILICKLSEGALMTFNGAPSAPEPHLLPLGCTWCTIGARTQTWSTNQRIASQLVKDNRCTWCTIFPGFLIHRGEWCEVSGVRWVVWGKRCEVNAKSVLSVQKIFISKSLVVWLKRCTFAG